MKGRPIECPALVGSQRHVLCDVGQEGNGGQQEGVHAQVGAHCPARRELGAHAPQQRIQGPAERPTRPGMGAWRRNGPAGPRARDWVPASRKSDMQPVPPGGPTRSDGAWAWQAASRARAICPRPGLEAEHRQGEQRPNQETLRPHHAPSGEAGRGCLGIRRSHSGDLSAKRSSDRLGQGCARSASRSHPPCRPILSGLRMPAVAAVDPVANGEGGRFGPGACGIGCA